MHTRKNGKNNSKFESFKQSLAIAPVKLLFASWEY